MVNTSTEPKPAPPKRIYFQPKRQVVDLAARARSYIPSMSGTPSRGRVVVVQNGGRQVVRAASVGSTEGDIIGRIIQEQNINRLANEYQQIRFAAITNAPKGADLINPITGDYYNSYLRKRPSIAIPTFTAREGIESASKRVAREGLPPLSMGQIVGYGNQVKLVPDDIVEPIGLRQTSTSLGVGITKQLTGRRKEDIPEIAERINRAKLARAESLPVYGPTIVSGFENRPTYKIQTKSLKTETPLETSLYYGFGTKKPKTYGVSTGINPYTQSKQSETFEIGAPVIPLAGKEANYFEQLSRAGQRAGYNYLAGTLNIVPDVAEMVGGKAPYRFKYIESPAQQFLVGESEKIFGDKKTGQYIQAQASVRREQSPVESDIELGLSSFGIGFDIGSILGAGAKGIEYTIKGFPKLIEVGKRTAKNIQSGKLIEDIRFGDIMRQANIIEEEAPPISKLYGLGKKKLTRTTGTPRKEDIPRLREEMQAKYSEAPDEYVSTFQSKAPKLSSLDEREYGKGNVYLPKGGKPLVGPTELDYGPFPKNLKELSALEKSLLKQSRGTLPKGTKPKINPDLSEGGNIGGKTKGTLVQQFGEDIIIKEPDFPTRPTKYENPIEPRTPKSSRKKIAGYFGAGSTAIGFGLYGLGQEPVYEEPTGEYDFLEAIEQQYKIKEIPTVKENGELTVLLGGLTETGETDKRKTSAYLIPITLEDLFQEPASKLSQKQKQQLFFEEAGKSPNPRKTKAEGAYVPEFDEVPLYDMIEIQRSRGLLPDLPLGRLQIESGGAFTPFDDKSFSKYWRVFDVAKVPFGGVKVGLGYYEDMRIPFEELRIGGRKKRINPFFEL